MQYVVLVATLAFGAYLLVTFRRGFEEAFEGLGERVLQGISMGLGLVELVAGMTLAIAFHDRMPMLPTGLTLAGVGGVTFVSALRRRARAPARPAIRSRWWLDSNGIGGVAAVGLFFLGAVTWNGLAVMAVVAWISMIVIELRRSGSAVEWLRSAFPADEHRRIEVEAGTHAFRATVTMPACRALPLRRAVAPASRTGDDAFDAVVTLDAADEIWRPLLDAELRTALRELLEGRDIEIADGLLKLTMPDQDAHGPEIEKLLRRAIAIDQAVEQARPAGTAEAAVLERIAAEPEAKVRRGHFEWLLSRDFEVPHVLRLAAADRDLGIADWAKEQLPPSDVYR